MGRRHLAALAALAALLGTPAVAGAHTHLADLRPEPEVSLARPPAAVTLRFSEPVDVVPGATGIRSGGREAGVQVARRAGGRVLVLQPRTPLAAGRVDVRFRVLSTDGHVLRGRYGFTVRHGAPATGTPARRRGDQALRLAGASGGARTGAAITHGLHHLLLVLALGLVLVGPLVLSAAGLAFPARGLRLLCLAGAALALLCGSLTWLAADGGSAARALAPHTISGAAGTSAGAGWLIRAGLWLLAAAVASRPVARVAVLGTVALSVALGGHAGSHGGAGSVAVDTVHLLAAGAWLGGLVVLAAAGRGDRAAATRAFARVAAIAFGALALTGVLNGLLRAGGLHHLTDGSYRRVVLAKLAIVVAVTAVAAVGRRRRASVPTGQVVAELVLGAGALTLAAILVETAPPS